MSSGPLSGIKLIELAGKADHAAASQITRLVDRQRPLQGQVLEHGLGDIGRLPAGLG